MVKWCHLSGEEEPSANRRNNPKITKVKHMRHKKTAYSGSHGQMPERNNWILDGKNKYQGVKCFPNQKKFNRRDGESNGVRQAQTERKSVEYVMTFMSSVVSVEVCERSENIGIRHSVVLNMK